MKQKITLVLLIAFCYFSLAQTVIKVIDGDTYKVLENGIIKTVRLANVDAPEVDQHFGKHVKDSVTKLLLLQTVQLEAQGKDLFNRTIVIFKVNGMSLDSLLISKGWAWYYSSYAHNTSLKYCEDKARLKGLGIWTCAQPIPP